MIHQRDSYYLKSFKADLDNKDLIEELALLRELYEGAQNVGELPHAILLQLAAKYQKKEKPVATPPPAKAAKTVKKAASK